jgi:hypothetical protein
MSQVNITLNTNTVDINTTNNQIVVTDPINPNVVNITQPVTSIVEVITAGPQGPPGPSGSAGPSGSSGSTVNTGSLLTTASFNAYTGSNTSQFAGTASYAVNALTASYLSGYVSPFPYTGSALITGSLGITGSTSILSGSLTIDSVNATNTLILSGSTPSIVFYNSGSISSNSSILIQDEAWGLKTTSNVFRFLINGSGSSGLAVGAINISKSGNNFTNIGIYPNYGQASAGGIYISGSGNVGIKTDTPTSGTLHVNGTVFASSYTGSLFGTASFANNTISASFSTSASFVISSSRAISSSFATSASFAQTSNIVQSIANNITNNGDNYLLTATGGGTINGEGQLTFDGTTFIANSKFQQGNGTDASGNYSHAEGSTTKAPGISSHAEGRGTISNSNYSHTEGIETKTGTKFAFRAGVNSGVFTLFPQYGNVTPIFTIGNTLISDDTGYDNTYGIQLYTISDVSWDGNNTIITITDSSITTSNSNIGDLNYIFQWGDYNGDQTISSEYSHAEGYNTVTIGTYSHAEGNNTIAVGAGSHAEGKSTIALGDSQHVQGRFNIPLTTSSSFIHGNGIDNANRSNLIHAYDSTVEITGSLNVSGSITGSLFGTASYAIQATQADYATSAGSAINATQADNATNAANAVSSSFAATASFAVSSSRAVSSSFATTASYVLQAVSASFATTASFAPLYLPLTGGTINGNVTVNGTASIAFLNVQYESASVIYSSGSNVFGDATNDTQTLNGTVIVSGSQQITGSLDVTGSAKITNGLTVTGSLQVSQSIFQYSNNTAILSGSTANIASFTTSSFAAGFFDFVATSGTNARAGTVFTVWNGNNVEYVETSTNDIGTTTNLILSASLSAGNIRLQGTSLSGSWSVKTLTRMI